jgi:HlyD family secretion protein
MTRKKKTLITVAVLIVGGAVVGANIYFKREQGVTVTTETIRARDLESIVSASGKVQPKRSVDISANQMGRVTRLAVEEGQRVKAGQFLLEIDPRQLEGRLQRGEAGVAAAQSRLLQLRTGIEQVRVRLSLSRQNLKRQQDLWKEGLTTREAFERAQNEVEVLESDLKAREQDLPTQEQQIRAEQATLDETRYNLTQIVISSPMDGIVTRRSIEEGETAVVGTMNNAGSVLLTIADMSQLEAEVEVDETDIPTVQLGQAAMVTIDAIPDREFRGRVTEIGNSPIQAATQGTGQRQATTFKVVITLDEEVPNVRPGFTCTAEITTATRKEVTAVPIQSLTVRERLFNEKKEMVPEEPRRRRGSDSENSTSAANEPPPGHTREEVEGVFVFRDGKAVFTPVKTGVAGERYFEVLDGLKAGDQVITGPFASVRELDDGEDVKLDNSNNNETNNRNRSQ